MKIPAGFLYLAVSTYGIYWGHHMITKRHATSPVWYWYMDLLLGAILLGIGAILRWTRWQARTSWLPVLGCGMIAVYYVGATVVTLRRYVAGTIPASGPQLGIALLPVLLVLVLLTVALFEKFRPELLNPPSQSFD
ncbi:MAG: hypothetical protein ABSA57_00795 [Candidatus Acidiferrales bacterium]